MHTTGVKECNQHILSQSKLRSRLCVREQPTSASDVVQAGELRNEPPDYIALKATMLPSPLREPVPLVAFAMDPQIHLDLKLKPPKKQLFIIPKKHADDSTTHHIPEEGT